MKQFTIRFLLLALLLVVKTGSFAYEFEVNGIYYGISNKGEAFVTCINYDTEDYSGDIIIPETVIYQGTTYTVTAIGTSAFEYCSSLKSISIPNSVVSIDAAAFAYCISLQSITLPNSVTSIGYLAFFGCTSLHSVTLPEGITSIGTNAFSGCICLQSITLPNSLKSLGGYAFSQCTNLQSVAIPYGVTTIEDSTFDRCISLRSVSLPNSLTSISSGAFRDCINLHDILLPNTLKTIGSAAFSNCINLESVTIPDGVTTIDIYTFTNCYNLQSISLPKTLTTIRLGAFNGCNGLKNIVIPKGVSSIEKEAFRGCFNLTMSLLSETPIELIFPLDVNTIEVPKGSLLKYTHSKYWEDINNIYSTDGSQKYVPMLLIEDGEKVVRIKDNIEEGIILPEGEAVDVFLDGEYGKYCFVMKGYNDISDSIKENGKYTLYPSINHKDNIIRTYAYNTKDIHLKNSGTLVLEIGREELEKTYSLKVSGEINGTDILAIRKMTNLRILDLEDATIVNGGTSYYESYTTSKNTIGDYFFKDKDNLIKVILPTNTEYIKQGVFDNCKNLKTILIPKSVRSCTRQGLGCDNLESLTFLCSTVGSWFAEQKTIKAVVLGASVHTICNYAFYQCSDLQSVTLSNSLTSIGDFAFTGCSYLHSIHLPNSLTSIGESAFGYCRSLNTIEIPDGVTSMGVRSFDGCFSLESISLPKNISSIAGSAFNECHRLHSITIPDGVTSIGCRAFRECRSLQSLTIPVGVTSIEDGAFASCSSLQSITIPNSVTSIEEWVFSDCSSLMSISLSNQLTSIKGSCFEDCVSLQTITLPNGITSIGDNVFQGCSSLQSITIPNGVISIGENSFNECSSLKDIYSFNPTPPIINENTFRLYQHNNSILHVPSNAIPIYWLHPYWENFKNIVELDDTSINDMIVDLSAKNEGVYTLDGAKLPSNADNLPKGIYIKNGKKVIIK